MPGEILEKNVKNIDMELSPRRPCCLDGFPFFQRVHPDDDLFYRLPQYRPTNSSSTKGRASTV